MSGGLRHAGSGPADNAPPLLRVVGLTKRWVAPVRTEPSAEEGWVPLPAVPPAREAGIVAVDFAVPRGGIVALVGGSGAGKTTAALAALRLVEPDAGTIEFDGLDLRALGAAELRRFRRRAGFVFQDPAAALHPLRAVVRQVAEPLVVHGLAGSGAEAHVEAGALLEALGLRRGLHERRPAELSGGERQRAALARALATRPDLLVLDEPFAALDPPAAAALVSLLQSLRTERGLSLLVVAHDLDLVLRVADEVVVLHDGRVVDAAHASRLSASARDPYTRALLAAGQAFAPGAPPPPSPART